MYVIVYANEGWDQGMVYLCRKLGERELMNARKFANQVANTHDLTIDESNGYIPNCSGDIRVEFTEHEPRVEGGRYQGSTHIWSGESFYFARD